MTETPTERIPLIEEQLRVDKRVVETGRVRVRTSVDESRVWVREDLEREEVDVVRVPIDRQVDTVPQVRIEDDVIIVPVIEEVVVVEKRLILVEELHVRRHRTTEHVEEPITLRRTRAEVERLDGQGVVQPSTLVQSPTGAKP
jgi:uncharacterized protein (TIGR02271 family)